ncbi:uncharacterized protein LOC129571745 isoform X2 [Sitodiplosis mosellana]|uniref:uncharacterized protein LOC129571745 isoform X2 n=1 Tax=Sitodiplosis mosellana TaxID=263140 RepID=UPI002444647B|nr:uncharacterized protein LOC129571745 isoform X2 [Sitodiplosis mosellana]XP_055307572.1 uncharacterized protein LOC129571745 isoform X2 [Sitodiplosis mosellana]
MIMPDKIHFLCSCPDYLRGTAKPTKKTTCKQCKGIKLPFAPIGGTVRMLSTPYVLDSAVTRNCFGTVRLPSALSYERQRPRLLCRENDPYNFLRQSRLLCMESQQQCNQIPNVPNDMLLIKPTRPFGNKSTRNSDSFSPIIPSEFYYNRSILNPYELISSTLHNNEFSPSASMYDLMRRNELSANDTRGTTINEIGRFNILDVSTSNRPTEIEIIKPKSSCLQPPPPPTLESLPLSVKSIPNKILKNWDTSKLLETEFPGEKSNFMKSSLKVNMMQNGLKKIIKETKSVRVDDVTTLTVGRSKRVQFNTLPELPRSKENNSNYILSDFGKQNNSNVPYNDKIFEEEVPVSSAKGHMNLEAGLNSSQRRKPVMRSMSDRRDKDSNEAPNFKDTTALRTKSKRASPQQLFQKPNGSSYPTEIARPTCPPPKLPIFCHNKTAPQRPPRQQRKSTKHVSSISKVDEAKASRIFGLLPVSTINKNKIQIHPIIKETNDPLNSTIQKTSITINNEACSSTVNVNEHVKNHHSSVLIKNNLHQIDDKDSQKDVEEKQNNLENISQTSTTEMAIVCHDKDSATSKNIDILEIVSTNIEKTKMLICLDYAHSTQSDGVFSEENESTEFTTKSGSGEQSNGSMSAPRPFADSFILKLLSDPYLSHMFYGLEAKTIANIIENSLVRLRIGKYNFSARSTKDTDKQFISSLHDIIKEERSKYDATNTVFKLNDLHVSNSDDFQQKELFSNINIKKLYSAQKLHEMLVDASLWKNGQSSASDSQNHQYESINCDPIYEEINEKPPPLPTNPPPISNSSLDKYYKPMFLGATKHDILSYLVDAKNRIFVAEEVPFKFCRRSTDDDVISLEKVPEHNGKALNIIRDIPQNMNELRAYGNDKCIASIERNDSGVGSETSKTSRTKYQPSVLENKKVFLCEDCDDPIQILDGADIYTPIICRSCCKKRAERREILWEFIETEKKYTRDLQIIIDEFYRPMLVAGLLSQEQLSAIFLNIEELLENSEVLCAKIRDALDTAIKECDDDLFSVDIGKIILETTPMLTAFETYCIQQAAASLLLANLEKDKELLRIFLRVSQMENTVLRRMNLNSFLMAEDDSRTKHWYNQLQKHSQGTGAWRKRRTALANIMINGMMLRQ